MRLTKRPEYTYCDTEAFFRRIGVVSMQPHTSVLFATVGCVMLFVGCVMLFVGCVMSFLVAQALPERSLRVAPRTFRHSLPLRRHLSIREERLCKSLPT